MQDAEIIERVLAGDTSRFGQLVDRYLPMVRAVCVSRVYEPAAHEDLVQESFVAAYAKLGSLRNPDRFGPWLARIARNKCTSWLRRRKRQSESDATIAQETVPSHPSPLSDIATRELTEWLHNEIGRLPPKTREAMLLCYVEGQSVAEASAVLNAKESAIKQRLLYGRRAIGEVLWDRIHDFRDDVKKDRTQARSRVLAVLPLATTPSRSGPGIVSVLTVRRIGIAFLLLVLIGGFLAWILAPSRPPATATGSVLVELVSVDSGAPLALDAPPEQIRYARYPYSRAAFMAFLEAQGVPEDLREPVETLLLDSSGYSRRLDEDPELQSVAPAINAAAQQVMAALGQMAPADALATWNRVFPPVPEGSWRYLNLGGRRTFRLDDLPEDRYVFEAVLPETGSSGSPEPLPWMDPRSRRVRVKPGLTEIVAFRIRQSDSLPQRRLPLPDQPGPSP